MHELWIKDSRRDGVCSPAGAACIFFFYLDLAGGKKIFHPRLLGHCERSRLCVLSRLGLLPQSGHEIFRRRWEIRWKWKQPSASVGAEEMASERWKIQEFHRRTERHSCSVSFMWHDGVNNNHDPTWFTQNSEKARPFTCSARRTLTC